MPERRSSESAASARRTRRPLWILVPRPQDRVTVSLLLQAVQTHDLESLDRCLLAEWQRLPPAAFVHQRIVPLLRASGHAWKAGRFEIRHERLLSRHVESLLRSLRRLAAEQEYGPPVLLATLPGESHALGLQAVALLLAHAGCRVIEGGIGLPVGEVAALATEVHAVAVGISISAATGGSATGRALDRLRRTLPPGMALVAGGSGARARPGVEVIADLGELTAWGRDLARRRAG